MLLLFYVCVCINVVFVIEDFCISSLLWVIVAEMVKEEGGCG